MREGFFEGVRTSCIIAETEVLKCHDVCLVLEVLSPSSNMSPR